MSFDEGHFRSDSLRKGKELLDGRHLSNVIEDRTSRGQTSFRAECIPEMSVRKAPYKIEFMLDENRRVRDARCSCVAGVVACCKHAAALYLFINEERCTGSTDERQRWHQPPKKAQDLYPKGETIEKLFSLPHTPGPSWKKSPADCASLARELEEYGLSSSSLFKSLTAKVPSQPADDAATLEEEKDLHPSILQIFLGSRQVCGTGRLPVKEEEASFYSHKILSSSADDIFRGTLGQSKMRRWYSERAVRISASVGHSIAHARTPDSCLKYFMEPVLDNRNLRYGRMMEPVARKKYEEVTSYKTHDAGLVVKSEERWLCSSPDAFVEDRMGNVFLLEIKCPSSCEGKKIDVPYIDEKGSLKRGTYHTQVQLQMYCCNMSKCHVFIYSSEDYRVIEVEKNEEFL